MDFGRDQGSIVLGCLDHDTIADFRQIFSFRIAFFPKPGLFVDLDFDRLSLWSFDLNMSCVDEGDRTEHVLVGPMSPD